MQVTLLDQALIEEQWPDIAERLWPAVRQDPTYNLRDLKWRLLNGYALAFEVSDGASGLWVLTLQQDDDGDLIAWTAAIAGEIEGGPKQRLATMREGVAALEQTLKQAGVRAHRICGRDWSMILPDYTPYAGARNGIEKRLA